MSGSTSLTVRGAALRFRGTPQPPRGKLTRAKLRALRILHRAYPSPVDIRGRRGVQRRTALALETYGVIQRLADDRYALTLVGLTAMTRYVPRPLTPSTPGAPE